MKISIIGSGNAGCFTALYYSSQGKEVELIHNPEVLPVTVGQATMPSSTALLWEANRFNWYNNSIHATLKTGILYEDWGKVNDKVFHPFPADRMSMHFCPWEMQKYVLSSGNFKVTEGDVDPKDVDADYVFDCRGKPDNFSDYDELKNPTNACILGKPNWDTTEALWSRHVATPDGWTFIVPAKEDSPSHSGAVGYCYNSNITKKEVAESNFLDMFDVEVTEHIEYKNYVAKNPIDGRVILNGNRLFFLEPLESTSIESYLYLSRAVLYAITNKIPLYHISSNISKYLEKVQDYILWHYKFGSKYDTPFWEYAKSLFSPDSEFNSFLETSISMDWHKATNIDNIDYKSLVERNLVYGQWPAYSFKYWHEGMNIHKRE